MTRWVILFRGINVGGHRKIAMAELRLALSDAGFQNVQSYIQSGNVVADLDASRAETTQAIQAVVARQFGFDVDVLVMTPRQLGEAVDDLPFDAARADPARVHLFFHLAPEAPVAIDDLAGTLENAMAASGARAHYLSTPDGMSKSKLAEQISRRLSGHATARNLRTCRKLMDMAAAR